MDTNEVAVSGADITAVMGRSCKVQLVVVLNRTGAKKVITVRNVNVERTDEELTELAVRLGRLYDGTIIGFNRVDTTTYREETAA